MNAISYPDGVKRINSTAEVAYNLEDLEGPGTGTGEEASKRYPPEENLTVLDIGFGNCKLIEGILKYNCTIFGVDIAKESWLYAQKKSYKGVMPFLLDVSHERLPFPDDTIDRVYCLETVEHLSNPYFCFSEAKRVLKPKGKFVVTFPKPEMNLGYEGGRHAHVYPGFLEKPSFERFMKQLYFKKLDYLENGDTAWYVYENIKNDDRMLDIFHVIAKNFTEEELYGWF